MAKYIDTHVHVWTDDVARYPLAPKYEPRDLAVPRYLPEDILSEAHSHDVNRVVLIQMSYYGFDNSFLLDSIAKHPVQFRAIAVIDDNGKDPAGVMRDLARHGVRGFRVMAVAPGERLANRTGLRAMLACASDQNLIASFLINPELLPDIAELCARFPQTPVLVDHLGRIGMAAPIQDDEVRALCDLARFPRAMVKVSAFYALGEKRTPHSDLTPLIQRVYEAFGPQRLMWGSDAPFQTMAETYEDSISVIRHRLPFLSGADQEWILRRTAEALFFS
jgi:predicted TIM-barrel fold metal-dependent hydrolase